MVTSIEEGLVRDRIKQLKNYESYSNYLNRLTKLTEGQSLQAQPSDEHLERSSNE